MISGKTIDVGSATDLRVDSLALGGRGVARTGGLVWLVEGALPGDRVRAVAERVRSNLVEGRTLEILEPSPDRRVPPCPLQTVCGGCPWMGLHEERQREWKRLLLTDAVRRIGRISTAPVEATVPSPESLSYRNKVEFTLDRTPEGRTSVGLHSASDPRAVVDVERCLLQGEAANRVLTEARGYFIDGRGKKDPALTAGPEPLRLVVRRSGADGTVLVALRGSPGPFRSALGFARRVRQRVPEVIGLVRILTRPGRRGGSRYITLVGRPWLEETLAGTRFRLTAPVFSQVNPGAAEQVVKAVLEFARVDHGDEVVDLYGGLGVYGLAMAERGGRVVVCEADAMAVECGRNAARLAGKKDVRFVRSDVGSYLRRRAGSRKSAPRVVVANPPRTGFARGVAEGIATLRPERIVVVSCDPGTLARDLANLVGHRYAVRRVVPVDMFPQTPHVESVTLLERG